MQAAPAGGRPVMEHCPSCDGFWLDAGKIDELRRLVMASDDGILARIVTVRSSKT